MAKPAPLPFSYALGVALTHKAVRKLQATQYGAFFKILRAALLEDFDPFSAKGLALQYHGGATPKQWIHIREEVLNALRVALPDITAVYRSKLEICNQRAHYLQKGRAIYAETRRNREKSDAKPAALTEVSSAPGILAPQKAPRHYNEKINMHARAQAKKAKISGFVLTDKG